MPYEEFKIHQVKAPEMEVEVTDFDELLPSKLTNNGEEAPIYFSEVTVHTSQEPGELLQIFKVKSTSSLGLHTYPTNYVPVSEKNDTIQMDNIEIKYLGQTQDESACMFEYTDTQNDIKQQFDFNLRYYKAFQGWRPMQEQQKLENEKNR